MVKNLLFFLLMILWGALVSANESRWCIDQGAKEIRALLEKDREGILLKQFELSTLKLALVASASNKKNLEAYVSERASELKGSPLITELESLYTTYGESQTLTGAIESFESANYWNSSLRMSNKDAALFTEVHRRTSGSSPFNRADSAVLWLFDQISKDSGPAGSAQYNKTLATRHIAQVLEGRDDAFEKLVVKVEKAERELSLALYQLLGELSAQWKLNCLGTQQTSCIVGNAFEAAILSIDKEGEWLRPIQNELISNELSARLQEVDFLYPVVPTTPVDLHPELEFSGMADLLIYDHHYLKYRDIARYQRELNELDNVKTITEFHRDSSSKEPYLIIDKKKGLLYKLAPTGDVLSVTSLEVAGLGDQFEDGGAGIFYLSAKGSKDLALRDEKKRGTRLRLQDEGAQELEKSWLVYILPEDEAHIFKVKNRELNFTTNVRRASYAPYNYSPKSENRAPTAFYINDSSRRNEVSTRFVNALSTEKEKLMKLYRLDNDEYNELAKLAFGILGNESDYGRSFKYHVKESVPLVVALFKGNGLDTSANSRGLTQMKRVPTLIAKEYGITKSELGEPEKAAIATMGFLADALVELKAKARKNPDINSDNQFDYLHYIYMGKAKEITEQTATPEKNIYLRQIREAGEGLYILERKEDS